jgi:hypothetical protein
VGERNNSCVKATDRILGIGNIRGDVTIEPEDPAC